MSAAVAARRIGSADERGGVMSTLITLGIRGCAHRASLLCFVVVTVLTILPGPHGVRPAAAGPILEITNPRFDSATLTLSDLVVYGTRIDDVTGNSVPTSKEFLEAGDASDNIVLAPGAVTFFIANFEIEKYFVSTVDRRGEHETSVLFVTQLRKLRPGWIADPRGEAAIALALDFRIAADSPAPGTIFDVVDGRNPNLPGWFVGTETDLATGEVTGAYTGPVEILAVADAATLTPEASSLTLLGSSVLLVMACGRRCLRARRSRVGNARSCASILMTLSVGAMLFLAAPGRSAYAGPIIKVSNPSFDSARFTLSDLVVYGAGVDDFGRREQFQFFSPGTAGDDIQLDPGTSIIRIAPFEIETYFISTTDATGEHETNVFDVRQLMPKRIGFLVALNNAVVPSLDYQTAAEPPPAGTVLNVVDGLSPTLPGWFFGTGSDFATGQVTGTFTGQVEFLADVVDVSTTVPEPSTIVLCGVALVSSVLVRRAFRGKQSRTRALEVRERLGGTAGRYTH
jgi:hypothetical protein